MALGMCCIARAAYGLGWCGQEVPQRIEALVRAHGLPTDTDLPHDLIVSYATHDKKRHGDGVNVVVPLAIGSVEVRHVSLAEFGRLVDLGCGVGA